MNKKCSAKHFGFGIVQILVIFLLCDPLPAQETSSGQPPREPATMESLMTRVRAIEQQLQAQEFTNESLAKQIDDLLWYQRVGEVCEIDKVIYTGQHSRLHLHPEKPGSQQEASASGPCSRRSPRKLQLRLSTHSSRADRAGLRDYRP